jgi:multicomponent Na+:H+ antiporter subunit E
MRHTISIALTLAIFWLVNSGHYTTLLLLIGAGSVAFVVYIAQRMDMVDHESQPIHLTMKLPFYYLWLIKEVIKSNVKVVKQIWLGNSGISPTVATITTHQKTDMGQVIYANSITLTPGTVSIDMDGDQITVHALFADDIEALKAGEMDRRVCHLEQS